MNCVYCPQFFCKKQNDYSRHLQTKCHNDNETISNLIENINKLEISYKTLIKRNRKNVTNEYLARVDKPIHIYNMRYVFVDIRDRLTNNDSIFGY